MKNKKFINSKAAEKFLDKSKTALDASGYIKGIKKKNKVLLSQAITLCESTKKEDHLLAEQILEASNAYQHKTLRIGITGSPGVGKSTFIEYLGNYLIEKGKKIAVLAVDPSSKITKGSILGDKTRMTNLSKNENAFIRPTASGSQLGGVARSTQETISLCEMAGYEIIIVETVGVGQSEYLVHSMTDVFLLLIQPGAGDELQGIKKGIVEMADVIVVNKADGDKIHDARQAKASYAKAIHLLSKRPDDWTVQVQSCSSLEQTGVEDIWDSVSTYKNHLIKRKEFIKKRKSQNLNFFQRSLKEGIWDLIFAKSQINKAVTELKTQILNGKINPFTASSLLLKKIQKLL